MSQPETVHPDARNRNQADKEKLNEKSYVPMSRDNQAEKSLEKNIIPNVPGSQSGRQHS
jgi:hypothetical protein